MNYEHLLKAISWTLIHSLWQGLVLSVLAGLVILFTRKSASAVRYNLLCLLFFGFIISAGLTLLYQIGENRLVNTTKLVQGPDNNVVQQQVAVIEILSEKAITQSWNIKRVVDFLNTNAVLIVLLWFVVFSVKCFGILRDLGNIYRLRNYRTQSPPEQWTTRLSELRQLIGVKRYVRLMESGLVSVPSVTGFIKPLILVPVGMLSHMSADQVEAILLHELAHIRRKDYIINFVQCFGEVIFFFNPGVLWLSSLIREERENCCDDLAIAVTQNKSRFVRALVSFQEYNLTVNQLSLGFGHQKTPLLNRAKRILYSNNKSLNKLEKAFLSLSLFVSTLLMFAFSGGEEIKAPIKKLAADINQQLTQAITDSDTLSPYFAREYKPADVSEGTTMQFTGKYQGKDEVIYLFKHKRVLYQVAGDARLLKVNGKLLTGKDREPYLSTVRKLIAEAKKYQEEGVNSVMTVDGAEASGDGELTGKGLKVSDGIMINGKTTHYFRDGWEVEVRDQKVVKFTIDGKLIPEEEIGKYLSRISMMMDRLNQEMNANNREKEAKFGEERKILDELKREEADHMRKLNAQSDVTLRNLGGLDPKVSDLGPLRVDYKSLSPDYKPLSPLYNGSKPVSASPPPNYKAYVNDYQGKATDYDKAGAEPHYSKEPKLSASASKSFSETTITDTHGNVRKKTGFASESIPKDFDVMKLNQDVIEDLLKENTIKSKTELSYKLDANELIVNNKKQPEELHKKLKEKYIKTPKSAVYYNYTNINP
jgi:beta-lactamase regulating signal transducer with metallopeptidase domain